MRTRARNARVRRQHVDVLLPLRIPHPALRPQSAFPSDLNTSTMNSLRSKATLKHDRDGMIATALNRSALTHSYSQPASRSGDITYLCAPYSCSNCITSAELRRTSPPFPPFFATPFAVAVVAVGAIPRCCVVCLYSPGCWYG